MSMKRPLSSFPCLSLSEYYLPGFGLNFSPFVLVQLINIAAISSFLGKCVEAEVSCE
jgi:hypothetical protein